MTEEKIKINRKLLEKIQLTGQKTTKYPYNYTNKIPFFNDFTRRYSESTFFKVRNKLIYFALYLEEKFEVKILKADVDQIKDFFQNDIDKRDILRESKSRWRSSINQYYTYVADYLNKKAKKTIFINPVPLINLFDFSEKEFTINDMEKEDDLLTYEIAQSVLSRAYIGNRRLFIIVSFLLYSGARISEICDIKIEEIDLEERFFFTNVKGKKALKRWGVYFFPEFFVPYLKKWIENIKIQYPKTSYLFPTPKNPLVSIKPKTPRTALRKLQNELGIQCKINPHAWRDFINTERFDKDLNVKYRSMLLNQTPQNVNMKHYLKKYKKRKYLSKIYDETLPFPEFKPNYMF